MKRLLIPVVLMLLLVISISPVIAVSLTYDANGNLVTGDGVYREYNNLNQLVALYNGSDNSVLLQTFVHHPVEERVLVKKTYNQSDSSHVLETVYYVSDSFVSVVNSSGTFDTTYVRLKDETIDAALGQRLPSGAYQFIHPDHIGSASIVTDASGAVVERTLYAPYGAILVGGNITRYDYESKEFDAVSGDYDFHFRKYNPHWGLFLQPDTLVQDVYDPQFLNRYAFEKNNPYGYTDPSGHNALQPSPGDYSVIFRRYLIIAQLALSSDGDYEKQYSSLRSEYSQLPENPYAVNYEFGEVEVQSSVESKGFSIVGKRATKTPIISPAYLESLEELKNKAQQADKSSKFSKKDYETMDTDELTQNQFGIFIPNNIEPIGGADGNYNPPDIDCKVYACFGTPPDNSNDE